jgi:hypothetical protein
MDALIDDAGKEASQGWVDSGHDRIVGPAVFQFAEEGVVVEARVGADTELSNLGGHVGPAVAKQSDGLVVRIGITRSKASSPQMSGVRFETEERLVRTLAAIAGIVADFSTFLVAEEREDGTVKVEDEARTGLREVSKELQQSVLDAPEFLGEASGGVEEEAS